MVFRCLVALLLFVVPAVGQVSLDVSASARSQYVVDNGVAVHDEPVGQLDLWFSLPHGLWADLWASTDFNADENGAREVDYGAGWANDWLGVGVFYFDFAGLFSQEEFGDVVRAHVQVSRALKLGGNHSVVPLARFEYLYATEDSDENSAVFGHVGLGHHWQVGRVGFDQRARLLYDSGIFAGDDGFVGSYSAAVAVPLVPSVVLNPLTFRVSSPLGGIHDARESEFVFGAGCTVSFDLAE